MTKKNLLNQNKVLSSIFFILFMADYFLTYIGINHFYIIEERNPFLQNFFYLPIKVSLFIRFFFAFFILFTFKVLHIHKSKYYKPLVTFAIISYSIVTLAHMRWVFFILMN